MVNVMSLTAAALSYCLKVIRVGLITHMDFCGTWQQHMRLCLRGRLRWWPHRPLLLLLGHSSGSPGPSLINTRDNIWVHITLFVQMHPYMDINPVCIKVFDLVVWTVFAALMLTFQTFHASWMIWSPFYDKKSIITHCFWLQTIAWIFTYDVQHIFLYLLEMYSDMKKIISTICFLYFYQKCKTCPHAICKSSTISYFLLLYPIIFQHTKHMHRMIMFSA